MSVRIMTLVWDMSLPATEKLVMLALADCANDEGECWPSIATLSRKTGASERTVQRAIQSFAEHSLLRRVEVPGRGCRYFLTPRQSVTPDKVSPVTGRRAPPTQRHPTPVTVSPKPSENHQEPSEEHTKRARTFPEGWEPSDFGPDSKCRQIIDDWPDGELETQLEHFTAHHRGKGSRFVDWQDAWKTWVLNSRKWNTGNGKQSDDRRVSRPGRSPQDGVASALDRRLGLDLPAEPLGRRDAGASAGHCGRALATPGRLF